MTDFLERLAARSQGSAVLVRPRPLATFEPSSEPFQEIWAEREAGSARTETRIAAASPIERSMPPPAVEAPPPRPGAIPPAAVVRGSRAANPVAGPASGTTPVSPLVPASVRAPSVARAEVIAPPAALDLAPASAPSIASPIAPAPAAPSVLAAPAIAAPAPAAVQRRSDRPMPTDIVESPVETRAAGTNERTVAARAAAPAAAARGTIAAVRGWAEAPPLEPGPPTREAEPPLPSSSPSFVPIPVRAEESPAPTPAAPDRRETTSPSAAVTTWPAPPLPTSPTAGRTAVEPGGTVEIRIGRVEIHAAFPEPARAQAAREPAGPSLDAFLARRPR